MKVSAFLAALAALAGVAAGAPIPTPSGNMTSGNITDILVFDMTLAEFTRQRNARDPSNLDWSSDGCTAAPDHPLGFEFKEGCQRHDFAYRNYKQQGRWSHRLRKRVDCQFRGDLLIACKPFPYTLEKRVCKALVDVYYFGARIFGHFAKFAKRSNSTDTATSALYEEYAEAQEIYFQLVREAQGQGKALGFPPFPT
ncbi:hypothetical protein EsDP_00005607 [Epichloe bromicola]|uniref:Uncharacterized protein n=1 Tax=Epichloe bromicola TaxID=79588 RepID=A0ABQ0CV71_9HYPO